MTVNLNESIYGNTTEPVAILTRCNTINQSIVQNLQMKVQAECDPHDLDVRQVAPVANGQPPTFHNDPEQNDSIYKAQWIKLFEQIPYDPHTDLIVSLNHLQEAALKGQLRNSPFRSLCWRFHLGLLPENMNEWRSTLTNDRNRFFRLIDRLNPLTQDSQSDDHPLSTEQASLWRQHFHSLETRRQIAQDVSRTFPNEAYFRDPAVQAMMTDLLECYTLENNIEYKQGMHEILAPICCVFRQDYLAFQEACETGQVSPRSQQLLSIIFNPGHFEADVYTVFEKVMRSIHTWYAYEEKQQKSPDPFLEEPLSPSSERTTTANPGITFLNNIHCRLLLKADRVLYVHLKQSDIDPALFGLRWIRLLFGHEFFLDDLLYLWDCIFAIGEDMALVPHVYVALLIHLRPELLSGDISECLSTLMRCPNDIAVEQVVKRALNMYNPKKYPPLPTRNPTQRDPRSMSSWNGKYRRWNGTASLSSKLSERSHSAKRRVSMFDLNRAKQLEKKSKSSTNLFLPNLGKDIAQSIISALSGRTTPSQSVNHSAMPTPTQSRRSFASPTSNVQEKIDIIYRRCVQALELCVAHMDVTICRMNVDEAVTVLQDAPNCVSQAEHLNLAKVQINRVRNLLDGLQNVCETTDQHTCPVSRPLTANIENTILRRDWGNPNEWIFSSAESSLSSQWANNPSNTKENEEQQESIDASTECVSPPTGAYAPGSVIRMERLGESRKKHRRKKGSNIESKE